MSKNDKSCIEADVFRDFETVVKSMTLVMEQIEAGSPKWQNCGGQSYGWKLLHWLQRRYDVPNDVLMAIANGFLRWPSSGE
jgi:hypothetical protein